MSPELLGWIAAGSAVLAAAIAAAAFWQARTLTRVVRQAGIETVRAELKALVREVAAGRDRLAAVVDAVRAAERTLGSFEAARVAAPLEPQEDARAVAEHPDESMAAQNPDPWANGVPVELDGRDGVRRSPSLAPPAFLVTGGTEGAELYVNPEATVDHVALREWARIYDFAGGVAYVSYTTDRPALVDWNPSAERGRLVRKGIARPLHD